MLSLFQRGSEGDTILPQEVPDNILSDAPYQNAYSPVPAGQTPTLNRLTTSIISSGRYGTAASIIDHGISQRGIIRTVTIVFDYLNVISKCRLGTFLSAGQIMFRNQTVFLNLIHTILAYVPIIKLSSNVNRESKVYVPICT